MINIVIILDIIWLNGMYEEKNLWPMKLFDVMPWFILKICLDELALHLKVIFLTQ
jgi:hypothetical protein